MKYVLLIGAPLVALLVATQIDWLGIGERRRSIGSKPKVMLLSDRIGEDLAWTIRRRSRAAMVIGFVVGLVAMLSADDGVSRDAIWVVGGAATISVLGGLLTGLVTYFLNEPKK